MNIEQKKYDTKSNNSWHIKELKLKEVLNMSDVYTLSMFILYSTMALVFFTKLNNSISLILINFFVSLAIISIAFADEKLISKRIFKLFRRLYLVPVIFLIYTQVQHYIRAVNPYYYDDILIAWDYWLFGVNPTQYLQRIAHPVLTEYLQTCYMSYYFIPLIIGVELHFSKSDEDFNCFSRTILFSFYLSYILYFAMPAVGPRFTLHSFAANDAEMPGIFLGKFFRYVVNFGGGIPPGAPNPEFYVNRDCMPSGHTMMTLTNIILAFKFRTKLRYLVLLLGSSLIFSTVYLRYHYVVDVIAGVFFCFVMFQIEPRIRNAFSRLGFIKV